MPNKFYKTIFLLAGLVLFLAAEDIAVAQTKDNRKIAIFNALTGEVQEVEKVVKSNAEWQKILTPEQYRIMRLKGTERPNTGMCELPGEKGIYKCAGCGTDLFGVGTKFESGTGWPSFWEPVSELNIRYQTDDSSGMRRTEVLCARCDAHLGHVFDDGPAPTGRRYCINSAALKFVKSDYKVLQRAAFGAGCFWGVEAALRQVKGVLDTSAGFMGGTLRDPTYEDVCTDKTGHAEVVRVEFDPQQVSYERLLDVFWSIHDPTTPNRQGADVGSQYRSVIFYYTPEQEKEARISKEKLDKSGKFKGAVVTEILPAKEFYKAEDYHQSYYEKRGLKPLCHIPSQ